MSGDIGAVRMVKKRDDTKGKKGDRFSIPINHRTN